MPSRPLAFALLSLYVSPEKAEEIEGDLLEESEGRGRAWLIVQVTYTAFLFFLASIREFPIRIALFGVSFTFITCVVFRTIWQVFSADDAYFPAPVIGQAAHVSSEFLIGLGLGLLARGVSTSAATVSTLILTLIFVITNSSIGLEQILQDLTKSTGEAALTIAVGLLSGATCYAYSIAVCFAPFMAGAVVAERRLGEAGS